MAYYLSKKASLPFDETIERVTEELKKEGFGIITTIDFKETLKKRSMSNSEIMLFLEPVIRDMRMRLYFRKIN